MKTLIRLIVLLGCLTLTGNPQAGERIAVLTLNVAGLPDMLTDQDNPEMRMTHIAERSQLWDLVAYQEDFYYSSWLDRGKFDTTIRGTKMHRWAWLWPWLRKSGLTIKTDYQLVGDDFQEFEECFGHLNYASDCWVPKGVMCARALTPGGLLMDFCTTHLDAGKDPGSSKARRSQIQQYNKVLPPPVLDLPWVRIEAGDYNLRIYQEDILPLVVGRDAVIRNTTGGNDVDFITVTTNDQVKVTVIESGKVPMFEGLSDHPGIGAVLDLEY